MGRQTHSFTASNKSFGGRNVSDLKEIRFFPLNIAVTPDGRYAITSTITKTAEAFLPYLWGGLRLWRLPPELRANQDRKQ